MPKDTFSPSMAATSFGSTGTPPALALTGKRGADQRGEASLRRPGLQQLDEARQPGVGLVAVHDPVVDSEADIGHRTDLDRVLSASLANDDALLQFADTKDRRLRLVDDDGRGEERARHAVIRDGEGAAANVGAGQFFVPRLLHQLLEPGRDALERKL